MGLYRRILALGLVLLIAVNMMASKSEALALYKDGDYEKALPLFMELYDANAWNKRDGSVNQWIGVCLFNSDAPKEAIPYLEVAAGKKVQESYVYLAKLAFIDNDYKRVDELLAEYDALLKKSRNAKESTMAKEFKAEYNKCKIMLSYVEQVAVIDSLEVDKAEFFRMYKLPVECGSLHGSEILANGCGDSTTTVVFANEAKTRLIWGEQNENGRVRLHEKTKLIDDKWCEDYIIGDNMAESEADINYPYLMPDGSTIYFAANGESSIGGYDIYVSMRDIDSGEYYQPQNMGMPYNSIYDDYMMVIDEFTGVGWWATDRNQLGDKLTIYIFVPNDIRKNYNPDREDIAMLAKVNAIKDSWVEGEDYAPLLKAIEGIKPPVEEKKADFYLPISKGVMYRWLSDFKSEEAKNIAYGWLELTKRFDAEKVALEAMRADYAAASAAEKSAMSSSILAKEREIEQLRNQIRDRVNAIIRAEK